jgi:hypothetical protein
VSTATSSQQFKSVEIVAEKVLADGTRIPLGVIGYWHRNPVMRVLHFIRSKLWPQS